VAASLFQKLGNTEKYELLQNAIQSLELNADSPTPSCKAAMGRIGGQRMGFDAPFFDN
jgi:hypothetical protein